MSLQWADFPNNQPGLYDLDFNFTTDGTPWLSAVRLAADPDPSSPTGVVMRHQINIPSLALSTPHTKAGLSVRTYVAAYDTTTRAIYSFESTGATILYQLRIRPNGGLELVRGVSTVIATADYPIMFTNSWRHVEMVADVVSGVIEVRVQGVTIPELDITDGSPPGGTVGIVTFRDGASAGAFYSKDLVVYNGAGSVFNDFLGSVSVTDIRTDADVTLGGWTTSSGATGWNLLDESPPDTADYISADDTPPAPAEFSFTSLDADVTSVRGLISIIYAEKTDGGDGNLQVSLTPNGVDYDTGADRAITAAGTYWWDVSELSPDTATAWTPAEVNAIQMRIDRTL